MLWQIYSLSNEIIENNNKENIANRTHLIQFLITTYKSNALKAALTIASLQEVVEAYENETGVEDLKKIIDPKVAAIKKELNLKHFRLHFHKAPAVSFYRSWTEKRGDNLESFRKTVIEVCKTGKAIRAIEIGKGGAVIRGIAPIVNSEGKVLGSVESYHDPMELYKYLKSPESNDEIVLLVEKDSMEPLLFEEDKKKYIKGYYKSWIISKKSKADLDVNSFLNSEAIEKVKNSKTKQLDVSGGRSTAYIPLFDFRNKLVALFVFSTENKKAVLALNNAFITIGVSIFLVSILLIIILTLYLTRIIIKPLKNTKQLIHDLASGNADLSKKLPVLTQDEIGQVAEEFNHFLDFQTQIIKKIKKVSSENSEVANKLSDQVIELKKGLLDTKIHSENIQKDSIYLDQEIKTSNNDSVQIKSLINDVLKQISEQSSAVNESSSSIEEMSASIINIANLSEEKLKVVNILSEEVSKGESYMEETREVIKKVADSANVIRELIGVINGIAEQTNLLAMNAAIEAAHAGDTGKGFAVVADEIRKLAEDSGKNSKEISSSLNEVIDFIHVSEEASSKTSDLFKKIVISIKEVANSMQEMKSSTDEMAVGSEQTIKALALLVKISESVNSSAKNMDNKLQNIIQAMMKFSDISSANSNKTEEIIDLIEKLAKKINEVSKFGENNNLNSKELEDIIGQFHFGKSSTALGKSLGN